MSTAWWEVSSAPVRTACLPLHRSDGRCWGAATARRSRWCCRVVGPGGCGFSRSAHPRERGRPLAGAAGQALTALALTSRVESRHVAHATNPAAAERRTEALAAV